MKIALVSPYDFATVGGVNNHVKLLRGNLEKLGNEVKILAPSSKKLDLEGLIILGSHPISVPASGSWARITLSLTLPRRVKRVVQEEMFDVIHLHEPATPFLPYFVINASEGTPKVATFHAAKDHGNKLYSAFRAPVQRLVMDHLDERICVSKAAESNISRYLPGEYKIIPNGIELSRFSFSAEPKKEFLDNKINILFVGRLDEKRKGFRYLFEAYARLQETMKDLRLIAAGNGAEVQRSYMKVAEQRGIENVVFTGFVPDEELPRLYRSAHIFCAPNIGQESFGIVLLEAMACGVPIVASKIPGFAGVITNGEQGLLSPPKDVEGLAGTLACLIYDTQLRNRMSEAGIRTAKQYDESLIVKKVLETYRSAISKHRDWS